MSEARADAIQVAARLLGWKRIRLKHLGRLKAGAGFPDAAQGMQGEALPFFKVKHLAAANAAHWLVRSEDTVSRETAAQLGAFVFPSDTIVFAKIGAALLLNRFRLLRQESCIDNNMMGFVLDRELADTRFMLHRLSLIDFAQVANPGAVPSLKAEQVAEQHIVIPPLAAQRVIADYLDRETARLDALVAAKERVLGLLTEKRRALITHAVTRGLDPRAHLRDSDIPWLGEIPAHWEIVALRFLVDIYGGATPNTGKPELWDGDIPWVSPKDMKLEEIDDAEDHVSPAALSATALRLIDPVAVLIVVRGMILAHSFPTATTTRQVTINQDMKALRCRSPLEPYFLRAYFWGVESQLVSLVDSAAHGTRKLETEVLGRFEVCVPPLEEQRAIVAYTGEKTARLDEMRHATERTIALLKERRAALIAAAVTGHLDVGRAA